MCYNVFTIKINLFEYKRFKHGRCTYKNTGSSHLYLRKLVNPKIASKQTQSTTKEKNSDKKKHLGKIHVFLITICNIEITLQLIGANGEPVQSRVEQDKGRVKAAVKALILGKMSVHKVM